MNCTTSLSSAESLPTPLIEIFEFSEDCSEGKRSRNEFDTAGVRPAAASGEKRDERRENARY